MRSKAQQYVDDLARYREGKPSPPAPLALAALTAHVEMDGRMRLTIFGVHGLAAADALVLRDWLTATFDVPAEDAD